MEKGRKRSTIALVVAHSYPEFTRWKRFNQGKYDVCVFANDPSKLYGLYPSDSMHIEIIHLAWHPILGEQRFGILEKAIEIKKARDAGRTREAEEHGGAQNGRQGGAGDRELGEILEGVGERRSPLGRHSWVRRARAALTKTQHEWDDENSCGGPAKW